MKKNYLLFMLIVVFNLSLDAQVVDTIVEGIRYSISKNRKVGKSMTLQCTMTNTTSKPHSFFEIGFENNKTALYNSKNERIGYDFISCGSFKKSPLPQDSSITFEVSPYEEIIPGFHYKEKEKYVVDSLYFFYWKIDGNTIGPVKYYLEGDLVSNLQSTNQHVRDIASKALLNLRADGKTTLRKGHIAERSYHGWISELKIIQNEGQEYRGNKFRGSYISNILDNSHTLIIRTDNDTIVAKRVREQLNFFISDSINTTDGIHRWYCANGNLVSETSFKNGMKDGIQSSYNRISGKLCETKLYEKGNLVKVSDYKNNVLKSDSFYKNDKMYLFLFYNKEGDITRKIKHRKVRKKRKRNNTIKRRYN